ncbi:aspartic peptidase domain-containing protein [Trichoderma austrokoningii]
MLFTSLAVVATATAALASPVKPSGKTITLPVKRVSTVKSAKSLVQKGHARLAKVNGVKTVGNVDVASGSITNEDVSYVADVTIGDGTYSLIVDTGSSNLWCGAQSQCEPSSTGRSTRASVSVSYGSGSFSGTEYTDNVSFGGLTVQGQSVGAADQASGFNGVDGIIGFGPVDLTENTVDGADQVPTFMDNLFAQGSISSEVLGVSFRPESGGDSDDSNGELTLGGTDSSKFSGSITYFPTLTSGQAAPYWGISIASFTYGSTTLASSATGIVDTGTTLIYIPTKAYNKFLSAAGGQADQSGLTAFSSKPTSNFNIKFGSSTFSLTPAQYLVPTAQYDALGLEQGQFYAYFADGGSSGVDTIIGQKFLENYYSVFDTTNSRIGFAPAV